MKRYKYYFLGLDDKPISIEAMNRESARRKLEDICNTTEFTQNGYAIKNLVKETTETLVDGVSTKVVKGHTFVWNQNGWSKSYNGE
jgi:hypothetical protein